MAYDPGAIDATLAAAVGDEPGLIAELRMAFVESVERSLAALGTAEDAVAWRDAALRLKGLSASFGAIRLMALASDAETRPFDTDILSKLTRSIARL
ncbi:Hpt domain-containing protein [Sphingomonas oligophenolica]|uniref:Hpt domain-containing protein n=1 Tax=Sphingomonas oligophenolica TaxID=301154 RepID=A0A502CLN8_9SPHN|nr:Hpt domain-containing protein [Sphingomonas oligophenolica]TPG12686.1 Hpt domain-containing protein [Sphingomonas oligophenolica]